jgi:hypothetical protein
MATPQSGCPHRSATLKWTTRCGHRKNRGSAYRTIRLALPVPHPLLSDMDVLPRMRVRVRIPIWLMGGLLWT